MSKVLENVAKAGKFAAEKTWPIYSWWYLYQPQEPVEVQKLREKRVKESTKR